MYSRGHHPPRKAHWGSTRCLTSMTTFPTFCFSEHRRCNLYSLAHLSLVLNLSRLPACTPAAPGNMSWRLNIFRKDDFLYFFFYFPWKRHQANYCSRHTGWAQHCRTADLHTKDSPPTLRFFRRRNDHPKRAELFNLRLRNTEIARNSFVAQCSRSNANTDACTKESHWCPGEMSRSATRLPPTIPFERKY